MSPLAPDNTNLLLGAGQVFFDRTDVDQGLVHLGNCTQFQVSFEDETREVINRMTASLGTYRKVTSKRTCRVNIVGQEFNPQNAALVTMGSLADLAVTGSSVTGEVLATAAQAIAGAYYQTAQRDISSLVLTQGTTTLVEGTDYEITDADLGLVHIISPAGANWTDATQVDADYTYASATNPTIRGGDTGNIYGKLVFIGDPAAGPAMDVQVWNVSIEPEGGLDFIGDDFLEWNLNCEALDDSTNHPNEPFFLAVDREDYR
jgi:hypothetical protein